MKLFLSVRETGAWLRVKDLSLWMVGNDCSFSPVSPALLQKHHHLVFGTAARLLVSISGEEEGCAEVCGFRLSLSDLCQNVLEVCSFCFWELVEF